MIRTGTMKQVMLDETKKRITQRACAATRFNSLCHAGLLARLHWARKELFGDLRVRSGVKLGLAGLIALFCAQMLRVPDDNWAILTVFVLMDAKYVGALAFKAIMRLTGTIVGALIGVWLASICLHAGNLSYTLFFRNWGCWLQSRASRSPSGSVCLLSVGTHYANHC